MADSFLSIIALPRRFDGAGLELQLLVLPNGNPLVAPLVGVTPFADATLRLQASLVPSLDALPRRTAVAATVPAVATSRANRGLLTQLESRLAIDAATPEVSGRGGGKQVRKYLSESYRSAFAFDRPRTPFCVTDQTYACAIRDAANAPRPPAPPMKLSWSKVISMLVRQPQLARAAGLLTSVSVTLPEPSAFADGGWIFFDLDGGDYLAAASSPGFVRSFAARLPPLTTPRAVFAPVVFLVDAPAAGAGYDEVFSEAETWDDGFAKIVHAAQLRSHSPTQVAPDAKGRPHTDRGILLGWDDEQLTIWQNRQLTPDVLDSRSAPMTVVSACVDVRERGELEWHSLHKLQGRVRFEAGSDFGQFEGERGVEAAPAQLSPTPGDFWLPAYFATWCGGSLAVPDVVPQRAAGVPVEQRPFEPVDADAKPLRFGRNYEFRVRYQDLAGGGAQTTDQPVRDGAAPVASSSFRRYAPPGPVRLVSQAPQLQPREWRLTRPLLGYPDLTFTGAYPDAEARLTAEVNAARLAGRAPRLGLADPDVTALSVRVQVSGLAFDPAVEDTRDEAYVQLYEAVLPFGALGADELTLRVSPVDVTDARTLTAPVAGAPLPIPTARNVRLVVTAIGREDPGLDYFGDQGARRGEPLTLTTRADATDERGLLGLQGLQPLLRGIWIRPDDVPSPTSALARAVAGKGAEQTSDSIRRLAAELGLEVQGSTLLAPPGRRVVFGCSRRIAHRLAPDGSSLTLSSRHDLSGQWLVVLAARLQRDWTWDGLKPEGIDVIVDGESEPAGSLQLKRSVSLTAVGDRALGQPLEADRSGTDLIFIDAVDPSPPVGNFPRPLARSWSLQPRLRGVPQFVDAVEMLPVTLPVVTPPAQTPRVVAAGLAFSPYVASATYAETESRERYLWVELAEPIADLQHDAVFGRVLAYAPDPLLTEDLPDAEALEPPEPPLPIDAEPFRVIVSASTNDLAGLTAMQRLTPAVDSSRHFLMPLPPGLAIDAAELLGLWTYELRIGHTETLWCTAQGRFGRPLRVTGVQHPAPELPCDVRRDTQGIIVSAPYATPVFNGRSVRATPPATDVWFLLYAQVRQADGEAWRNLLLGEARGRVLLNRTRDQRVDRLALTVSATELRGITGWDQRVIANLLATYGLPASVSLSVTAVEVWRRESSPDQRPLSVELGEHRLLRTSRLVPVPEVCIHPSASP